MAADVDRGTLVTGIVAIDCNLMELMLPQLPFMKSLPQKFFEEIINRIKTQYESVLLSNKFSNAEIVWLYDWKNSELFEKIKGILALLKDIYSDGCGVNVDDDEFQKISAVYFSQKWNVSLDEVNNWKSKCSVELADKVSLFVKEFMKSSFHNNSIEYCIYKTFNSEEISKILEFIEHETYKKGRVESEAVLNDSFKIIKKTQRLSALKTFYFLWNKFNKELISKDQFNSALTEDIGSVETLPIPNDEEKLLIRQWLEALK